MDKKEFTRKEIIALFGRIEEWSSIKLDEYEGLTPKFTYARKRYLVGCHQGIFDIMRALKLEKKRILGQGQQN